MRKLIFGLILAFGIGIIASALPVTAEETQGAEQAIVEKDTSIGFNAMPNKKQSAQFLEYRDIPKGLSVDMIGLGYRKGSMFYGLEAEDTGQEDQRYLLSGGKYGLFKINLSYTELPHRFVYDMLSRYSGFGTGVITFPLDARQYFETSASNSTQLVGKLKGILDPSRGYLTDAERYDSQLFRKTAGVDVKLYAAPTVDVKALWKRERREGSRPFFGPFAVAQEIVEPIDYDTTDYGLTANWASGKMFANASYNVQKFENRIGNLIWDNVLRASDSSSGPSRGRIDLYPDNECWNFTLNGGIHSLPNRGNLTVLYSQGRIEQNDLFLPYTINTAVNTASLGALPKDSLNGRVDTRLLNIGYSMQPFSKGVLRLRFRDYKFNNKTDEITFPGYVRFDAGSPTTTAVTAEPFGYHTTKLNAELDYEVCDRATLEFAWSTNRNRTKYRETDRTDDDGYRIGFIGRPLEWMDIHANWYFSDRDYNNWSRTAYPPIQTYDESNRNKQGYQFQVVGYPSERAAVTATLSFNRTSYPDAAYGLKSDKSQMYGLDFDYSLGKASSMNLFLSHEKFSAFQKSHAWTSGGVGDPNAPGGLADVSPSDWTADNQDHVTTIGAGLNWSIIPKKLNFVSSYSFARARGRVLFASPIGIGGTSAATANDSNAFDPLPWPNVDSSRNNMLDMRLNYQARRDLTLSVGWTWEQFSYTDYLNNGFDAIPTTAAGTLNGLYIGSLPVKYSNHILYSRVSWKF